MLDREGNYVKDLSFWISITLCYYLFFMYSVSLSIYHLLKWIRLTFKKYLKDNCFTQLRAHQAVGDGKMSESI